MNRPHFITGVIALLTSLGRIAATAILLASVSGAMLPALQGVAWIEMAQKAGGLHKLGEAITQFEPCEHCCAVQGMMQKSGDSKDSPAPTERTDVLRTFATLPSRWMTPPIGLISSLSDFPIALSDSAPRSLAEAPLSPPPRGFGGLI